MYEVQSNVRFQRHCHRCAGLSTFKADLIACKRGKRGQREKKRGGGRGGKKEGVGEERNVGRRKNEQEVRKVGRGQRDVEIEKDKERTILIGTETVRRERDCAPKHRITLQYTLQWVSNCITPNAPSSLNARLPIALHAPLVTSI
jgi:hypothetical protein